MKFLRFGQFLKCLLMLVDFSRGERKKTVGTMRVLSNLFRERRARSALAGFTGTCPFRRSSNRFVR